MANIIRTTTRLARYLSEAYMTENSLFIDATCGNGQDTLFLAKRRPSLLYAFDIQQDAIDRTRLLLQQEGFDQALSAGNIRLICASHEDMGQYVSEQASLILFNLGYLPGGDKEITTKASSTLHAVQNALQLLLPDGLLCITLYSGHPEGKKEKEALLAFAETLDSGIYHAAYISMTNQHNAPPEILLITRKK